MSEPSKRPQNQHAPQITPVRIFKTFQTFQPLPRQLQIEQPRARLPRQKKFKQEQFRICNWTWVPNRPAHLEPTLRQTRKRRKELTNKIRPVKRAEATRSLRIATPTLPTPQTPATVQMKTAPSRRAQKLHQLQTRANPPKTQQSQRLVTHRRTVPRKRQSQIPLPTLPQKIRVSRPHLPTRPKIHRRRPKGLTNRIPAHNRTALNLHHRSATIRPALSSRTARSLRMPRRHQARQHHQSRPSKEPRAEDRKAKTVLKHRPKLARKHLLKTHRNKKLQKLPPQPQM